MRLFSFGLIVAVLAVSPHATVGAAPKKIALTVVDSGAFTFLSQASALINGDGFAKQGSGLNNRVSSRGQLDLLGPATKCVDGFTARLAGTFVDANAADTFSYVIDHELCPTGEPAIYSGSGTYTITGGTGKYACIGKGWRVVRRNGGFRSSDIRIPVGRLDFLLARHSCDGTEYR